jgi:hypothetical protein
VGRRVSEGRRWGGRCWRRGGPSNGARVDFLN